MGYRASPRYATQQQRRGRARAASQRTRVAGRLRTAAPRTSVLDVPPKAVLTRCHRDPGGSMEAGGGMASLVLTERRGTAQWITINRPERRNALNQAVGAELIAALDAAERDEACRLVVLTGAGEQAFCAGADLERNAAGGPFVIDPAEPKHFIAELLARLDSCSVPTIARVNGPALAWSRSHCGLRSRGG